MRASDSKNLVELNHYQVLELDARNSLTPREIKSAYHQGLLRHHPDKAPKRNDHGFTNVKDGLVIGQEQVFHPPKVEESPVSIDRLSLAYQTLSDPKLKADYDRLLLLSARAEQTGSDTLEKAHQHPGVDVVDLEDMDYDEPSGLWRRACRCGDRRAYELREADLEREQSHGEIYVGCKGCSLFIKVVFQVVDEDEEGGSSLT